MSELKPKYELHEVFDAVIEIDNEYPSVTVHRSINEYMDSKSSIMFFDEDQKKELRSLIAILEKGLKALEKDDV